MFGYISSSARLTRLVKRLMPLVRVGERVHNDPVNVSWGGVFDGVASDAVGLNEYVEQCSSAALQQPQQHPSTGISIRSLSQMGFALTHLNLCPLNSISSARLSLSRFC